MGRFNFFNQDDESKKLYAQICEVMELLKAKTEKPVVYIKTSKEPVTDIGLTASKFGGVPYVPKGNDILSNMQGNSMIAQINCADLPVNGIYPTEGLFQFWIDNDSAGYDYNKVIYYESIGEALSQEEVLKHYRQQTDIIENEACYALTFEASTEMVNMTSEYFTSEFENLWEEKFGAYPTTNGRKIWRIQEEWLEEHGLEDERISSHKIGGYAYWVQGDVMPEEQDRLFLQIGSEDHGRHWKLLWGDCGVANWHISAEEIKQKKYDNLFYNIDCS